MISDLVEKSKVARWFMTTPPRKRDNYVSNFLARKLFLVCCLQGGLRSIDWTKVEKETIFSVTLDAKQNLVELPEECSGEELSWFLHRRPDRLIFSSMWACLFHKAVEEEQEIHS